MLSIYSIFDDTLYPIARIASETAYTYIVQGLVIIVAVAIDIRKYLAKK